MSPNRPRRSTQQLRDSYEETLAALHLRFEQLEAAVAGFQPDLDERALSTAWLSDDPLQRNRADAVLSCFEKTYMLLMDLITLAVKLARRVGAVQADDSCSAMKTLRDARVLSAPAEQALAVQREVRNASQHVYVELTMPVLRDAVNRQLRTTPRIVSAIAAWINSLDNEEDESTAAI